MPRLKDQAHEALARIIANAVERFLAEHHANDIHTEEDCDFFAHFYTPEIAELIMRAQSAAHEFLH